MRADDLPSGDPLPFDAGSDLEALLLADDRLAALDDDALLVERLGALDGRRTLGDAAAVAGVDRAHAITLCRSLISKGLLRFAADQPIPE